MSSEPDLTPLKECQGDDMGTVREFYTDSVLIPYSSCTDLVVARVISRWFQNAFQSAHSPWWFAGSEMIPVKF